MFAIARLNRLAPVNIGLSLRRLLHLQTLTTPNENALKFHSKNFRFLPPQLGEQAIQIDDMPDATYKSRLGSELFKLNGVKSLMIGPDFVSVNKVDKELSNNPELNWNNLSPKIINIITNVIENNIPIFEKEFLDDVQREKLTDPSDEDDDITYEIKELINTRIRPALQDDGGDIHFRKFDPLSGVVYIKLQGACKSCSLNEDTLKNGIESMLKHYIDEVEEVKTILDPEEEIALQEFEKLEAKLRQNRMN